MNPDNRMNPDEKFDAAVETVLRHEGTLSDDPADRGGLTHYGIILPVLREAGLDVDGDGDIDRDDLLKLSRAQAIEIYRRLWWNHYRYGELPAPIGAKLFDLAVNMGPVQAHKCLQRALRAVALTVKDDGVLGPITREVAAWAASTDAGAAALLAALRAEAAGVYRQIAAKDASQRVFLAGWLKRAYE